MNGGDLLAVYGRPGTVTVGPPALDLENRAEGF
jgi:hypothetical protein